MNTHAKTALVLTIALAATLGCSVKRYAVDKVGDALSQGGSTYESDDDIELVGDENRLMIFGRLDRHIEKLDLRSANRPTRADVLKLHIEAGGLGRQCPNVILVIGDERQQEPRNTDEQREQHDARGRPVSQVL